MEIQKYTPQPTGPSKRGKKPSGSVSVNLSDSVKISGKKKKDLTIPKGAQMAQLTRSKAADMLLGNAKVDSSSLESTKKILHKSEKIEAAVLHGLSSTRSEVSPLNGDIFTGMVGESDKDREFGKKYLTAFNRGGKEKWSYKKESITSDPVTDDKGNVYFRTQNSLVALAPDGKELWTYKAGSTSDGEPRERLYQVNYREGKFEDKAPKIGKDGTVFVMTCDDNKGEVNPRIAAVKDGKEIWSVRSDPSADWNASFTVKNDLLYVSRIDSRIEKKGLFRFKEKVQQDVLACYNPDGSEKYKINLTEDYSPAATNPEEARKFDAASDGSVYVKMDRGTLVKYNPDGKVEWEKKMSPQGSNRDVWLTEGPVVRENGSVLLTATSRDWPSNVKWKSVLREMAPDGSIVWEREFDSQLFTKPVSAPDGDIYIGAIRGKMDEELHHLNNTGIPKEMITMRRGRDDVPRFRSIAFDSESRPIIETVNFKDISPSLNTRMFSHEREISLLPSEADKREDAIREAEENPDSNETGTIETTEEFVIINGVKLPVKKGQQ